MNIQQYADLKMIIQGGEEYSEFSPYMGRSEFDTHMDLESLNATLIKYSINSLFSNTIITIYPHSMLIDLKPFVTFAPIPMN